MTPTANLEASSAVDKMEIVNLTGFTTASLRKLFLEVLCFYASEWQQFEFGLIVPRAIIVDRNDPFNHVTRSGRIAEIYVSSAGDPLISPAMAVSSAINGAIIDIDDQQIIRRFAYAFCQSVDIAGHILGGNLLIVNKEWPSIQFNPSFRLTSSIVERKLILQQAIEIEQAEMASRKAERLVREQEGQLEEARVAYLRKQALVDRKRKEMPEAAAILDEMI